ncbi:MAG: molybdopterin-dependent oxidoreductase [Candidatus Polarisedimenticolaceae bacterium]|nr:molybdopterin-dependent oxidoreductase [Candidatus Polarisedimenticolaceae bacterium]
MEERIPGYCALCISRCGCISVVNNGVLISVEPFPEHPTGKSLCIKGRAAPELVYSSERLLTPMKRTHAKGAADPGWQPISWHEALTTIAEKLQKIRNELGSEAVAFGVTTPSGTAISDSFVWINRLAHAFGSPNTVFATENCNWHKDFAPNHTFGNSIGMPDYERSGAILLWGFNPATSWLAQAELINSAVKRGAKLIVIDPRKAGLAKRADEWLRVRPAADGPLAMALAHQLISNRWFDEAFIRHWSNGPLLVHKEQERLLTTNDLGSDHAKRGYLAWDTQHQRVVVYDPTAAQYQANRDDLALWGEFDIETALGKVSCKTAFQHYADACSHYTPSRAEALTDIPAQQIINTARLLHESGPVSYFTWTGTAQQGEATQTGRAISLLYALTGYIDAPGGNCYFTKPPVANLLGLGLLSEQQRAKGLGVEARPLGPGTMGWVSSYDLYKSIMGEQPYPTKALISFGGNPLLTKPNANAASKALQQLEFYVHADLFLNATADHADIVLPVASPWERAGLYPGFQISQQAESLVQLRPAVIPPRGESRSDSWIVFGLAKQLGLSEEFFGGDLDSALQHLIEPTGLTVEELKAHPEGVTLSLECRYQKYRQQDFATLSKKLEIFSDTFRACGYPPIPTFEESDRESSHYPLRLISAKWIGYCHSQQRQLPSLRKHMPEPLVELNPQTAAEHAIEEGEWLSIESSEGVIRAKAKFNKSLATDVICSQYGWWQAAFGNYNNLISDSDFDPISSSNRLRHMRCKITK